MQSSEIFFEVEKSMKNYCNKYGAPSFLTQEEWKYAGDIEAVLHYSSRLTTICQNEKKLILCID